MDANQMSPFSLTEVLCSRGPEYYLLARKKNQVWKMNFLRSLFIVGICGILSVRGDCPDYYTGVGDKCYRYVPEEITWYDAEHLCEGEGAHMVSMHSASENQLIFDLWNRIVLDTTGQSFWTGLSDGAKEGTYTWCDGTNYNYKNWNTGEPSSLSGEDCVAVANLGDNDVDRQKWNDVSCSDLKSVICQVDSTDTCT